MKLSCVYLLHFIYPFICYQYVRCSHLLTIGNSVVTMILQTSLESPVYCVLGVKLMDEMVAVGTTL